MWKAFQRYRALDPKARALFRRAALLLPWIAFSLRFRGFRLTQAALQQRLASVPASGANPSQDAILQMTCRMVKAAAHHGPVKPTCLVDSLTLWYLLQRQNIPATLKIGVRKQFQKLEAHAWVECNTVAVNQSEEQHRHYAPFEGAISEFSGDSQ